jgi:hypothetical protein
MSATSGQRLHVIPAGRLAAAHPAATTPVCELAGQQLQRNVADGRQQFPCPIAVIAIGRKLRIGPLPLKRSTPPLLGVPKVAVALLGTDRFAVPFVMATLPFPDEVGMGGPVGVLLGSRSLPGHASSALAAGHSIGTGTGRDRQRHGRDQATSTQIGQDRRAALRSTRSWRRPSASSYPQPVHEARQTPQSICRANGSGAGSSPTRRPRGTTDGDRVLLYGADSFVPAAGGRERAGPGVDETPRRSPTSRGPPARVGGRTSMPNRSQA